MIDGMLSTLKEEQNADDHKSAYCHKQFDSSDDKQKGLARSLSDLEISIDEATEGIATLKEEIESLEERIKDLDKSVTAATEQRKSEHADFTEMMASDSAAKELLKFAINRLNKFYNPKLYKAQSDVSGGQAVLAEVSLHDAPPPPPATFDAYSKKSEESGGVIQMIKLLVKNLDKEMTEAETAEKDAQNDYEQMLKDSADKRANDSKTLTDKNIAKASMEADVQASKDAKASTGKELMAINKYISSLHA